MSFWYLATPYSKFPGGLEEAYRVACRAVGDLMRAKVPVFSPIAHGHGASVHGGIDPVNHDLWIPADRPFMDASCGLIVLQADGWQDSYGIGVEIGLFVESKKPILYMAPGEVPTSFREEAA